MERKDNTLKFTPISIAEQGNETKLPSRFIPIEDVAELYVFGSLKANSSLYNFLGQRDVPVHFFDYYENYTGSFMPRSGLTFGKGFVGTSKNISKFEKTGRAGKKVHSGCGMEYGDEFELL